MMDSMKFVSYLCAVHFPANKQKHRECDNLTS